jgi:hypothetical protein
MFRSAMLLVGGWMVLCGASLGAQEAILGQMYGNGVHAYFAGDYVKAHQCMTSAIEGHTQDARCHYFRGLACLKLGRPQDADLDFQQGAKLECADLNRTYNVAKSLERVQGADRAAIEQYRVEARMLAMTRAEEQRKLRYEQTQKQEQQLLSDQAGRAPEKPSEPEAPKPPIDDPFNAGGPAVKPPPGELPAAKPEETPEKLPAEAAKPETPAEKAVPEPAAKAVMKPAADDPFAAPAKPAAEPAEKLEAKPAAEDPFAAPAKPAAEPAKPAPETPGATEPAPAKPSAGTGKPGGILRALGHAAGAAAAGDAAKGGAPAKPAAPAKADGGEPAGGLPAAKPAAKAADPFAEEAAPAKPAAKKPAADAADPFAEEAAPAAPSKTPAKAAAKADAEAVKPAPAGAADPFGP